MFEFVIMPKARDLSVIFPKLYTIDQVPSETIVEIGNAI